MSNPTNNPVVIVLDDKVTQEFLVETLEMAKRAANKYSDVALASEINHLLNALAQSEINQIEPQGRYNTAQAAIKAIYGDVLHTSSLLPTLLAMYEAEHTKTHTYEHVTQTGQRPTESNQCTEVPNEKGPLQVAPHESGQAGKTV